MKSIVLIGMPGAGKSTVGRLLAARLGRNFIDTDQVIEQTLGKTLQQISDQLGVEQLKQSEESVLLTWEIPKRSVIATGGSVIYSAQAIERLKSVGVLVYLQAHLGTIKERVSNWQNRGFVVRPGQTLEDVYRERIPKYQAAADRVIDVDSKSVEEVVSELVPSLSGSQ